MKYVHATTTVPVVNYLVKVLQSKLEDDKKVLWLMSGGSGGRVCIEVSKQLVGTNLQNLSVTLSDERYGPVGHKDENWQMLLDGGLSLPGATMYRPLIGLDRVSTTLQLSSWLKTECDEVDYVIGLFGIGADGHTAGIKPKTVILGVPDFATDFSSDDFERITMTSTAIENLDEAVVQAMGSDKSEVVDDFINKDINPNLQPAQLLKTVPKVTIFTDFKNKEKS